MVTMEDASRARSAAFFVEDEGTLSRVRGRREGSEPQGLVRSLSPDRGAPDWSTEETGGTGEKTRPTPGHRAVPQRGIPLMPADSPEARGRSARAVRTRHDRVPQAVALAGIMERAAANPYLAPQVLPAYHQRGAGPASDAGPACIPWSGTNLLERLCVHEERVVATDHPVHSPRQLPQDPHRFHYVKVPVQVHADPDGTRAVCPGPRWLARSHAEGRLLEPEAESRGQTDAIARSGTRPLVDPRATGREDSAAQG